MRTRSGCRKQTFLSSCCRIRPPNIIIKRKIIVKQTTECQKKQTAVQSRCSLLTQEELALAEQPCVRFLCADESLQEWLGERRAVLVVAAHQLQRRLLPAPKAEEKACQLYAH